MVHLSPPQCPGQSLVHGNVVKAKGHAWALETDRAEFQSSLEKSLHLSGPQSFSLFLCKIGVTRLHLTGHYEARTALGTE